MNIFLIIVVVGLIFYALSCLSRIAEASEETADAIIRIAKIIESEKQRQDERN